MRDHGLQEAIRAVGGIGELARRLGISQPSVSNWERVPAERVLSVEQATGIARGLLRPDLFAGELRETLDEVDVARAREYALLATLLGRSPDAVLLKRLAQLRGDATPLGLAHAGPAACCPRYATPRNTQYFPLDARATASEFGSPGYAWM